MTTLAYRPYQPQDADDVRAIIGEAFNFQHHIASRRLCGNVVDAYLLGCLLTSSYAAVAVADGRVVGVLMGRVAGQPRLPGGLANRLRTGGRMLAIAALGLPEARTLAQYVSLSGIYRSLRRSTEAPLTDELTLFAVGSAARGLGAGRTLYEDFLQHLREHGRTDFYLYTDSMSSYGFYDRRGLTRAAEQGMTVSIDGRPEHLDVYLYTGRCAEPA